MPLPVLFFDERLSTAAVTRTLLEADASRARRGELVDKLAAAYILQSCLDVMGGLLGEAPGAVSEEQGGGDDHERGELGEHDEGRAPVEGVDEPA